MKILTDEDVLKYLDTHLLKELLVNEFIVSLAKGLITYSTDPDKIVPPRIAQLSNNPESDTTHLYMPCISPDEVGIKIISGGPSNNSKGLGFTGGVLILNEITGSIEALLNGTNLTAFRTALASILGVHKVIGDKEILPELTVFGVGLQSYWHIKLCLILYSDKIKQVNIINRTLENAEKLKHRLSKQFPSIQFNIFSYKIESHLQEIKNHCQNTSIIFGCSPSLEPIIMYDYINQSREYPTFISLIGSYKPHMIELDLKLIDHMKQTNTKILVDSIEHCLHESGELIQGNVEAQNLLEITDLYKYKDDSIISSTIDPQFNLTIQKIVGLSIMDINIGKYIVDHSNTEGIVINNF